MQPRKNLVNQVNISLAVKAKNKLPDRECRKGWKKKMFRHPF
jgi:hypothetical protein